MHSLHGYRVRLPLSASALALLAISLAHCGGSHTGTFGGMGGASNSSTGTGGTFLSLTDSLTVSGISGTGTSGTGWSTARVQCSGADPKATSLKGKVFDPAGKLPLYNVIVYVPNDESAITPFANGASCDVCGKVPGGAASSALTDATGAFTLTDMPVGHDVPVIVQVGKWRRKAVVPEIKSCQENTVSDPLAFRLPRNKTEGEIPKIAITAGDADRLQCLFTRLGIDKAEFSNPDGTGSIHIYNDNYDVGGKAAYDNGTAWPSAIPLWSSADAMKKYDLMLMACGGSNSRYETYSSSNVVTDAMKLAVVDYVNSGGRLFAEHYHWGWLKSFPPLKTYDPVKGKNIPGSVDNPASIVVGTPPNYTIVPPFGVEVATWDTASNALSNSSGTIDQSFPKGQAFAEWLHGVVPSNALGTISLGSDVKSTALTVMTPPSQSWITTPGYVHYFTFNTPVTATTADAMCGRVVFSGLHVSTAAVTNPDPKTTFPTSCVDRELSPPEKALAFMLFDLSACLTRDEDVVVPPPL